MAEAAPDTDAAQPADVAAQLRGIRAVQVWLYSIALLIAVMVVVGGATRLTDSGLSITEWQLVSGVIPPLTEAQWQAVFEKYQEIPEYKIVNRGMSLAEFKVIYWWEWAHRFLGRFVGLAFFLPMVFFWLRGHLTRALKPRLLIVFALGAAQGALGWYMVQSGLVDRVDVSQYRLAAHLGLAVVLFAYVFWLALGLRQWLPDQTLGPGWAAKATSLLIVLVFGQIVVGGFVAGLDAGQGYNTWPLMDGALVPEGLLIMSPAWRNLFENAMTVQFVHRMLAYAIVLLSLIYLWALLRRVREGPLASSAALMVCIVLVQVALGVMTLLYQVPLSLALCHQVGALVLLALALHHLHVLVWAREDGVRARE